MDFSMYFSMLYNDRLGIDYLTQAAYLVFDDNLIMVSLGSI